MRKCHDYEGEVVTEQAATLGRSWGGHSGEGNEVVCAIVEQEELQEG